MKKPIAIDLFCGAGGMSEGILQAGFHIVFSSDINEDVEKTYKNRHKQLGLIEGENTRFKRADIRELTYKEIVDSIQSLNMFKGKDFPEIDAIFGGPPCQGFSRAGKRQKDDPRNMLFKEYLRIINDIRPKYVVMENVEGFMDSKLDNFVGVLGRQYPDNSLLPEILQSEFVEIGYHTLEPQTLDASNFGVPQRRKRAIFIAYLDGQAVPKYPTPTTLHSEDKVNVAEAINDLIVNPKVKESNFEDYSRYQMETINGRTPTIYGETLNSQGIILNHDLSNHNRIIQERFSLFREGETSSALKKRIKKDGINIISYPSLLEAVTSKFKNQYNLEQIIELFQNVPLSDTLLDALMTKKNNRFRFKRDTVSPTVLTLPDDYLTPYEDRIPTVREMARLQSFDDSFEFLGKRTTGGPRRKVEVPQYTQVGNAVPPLLAKAIALSIKSAINKNGEVYQLG
ncbi:DNA cytosine methyltransferase [Priestia megaterium]|uniref:DNA cytosine methyltransferase n=1 Tax=Priestia megaterium TaxID=1404 RepID=UPI003EED5D8F